MKLKESNYYGKKANQEYFSVSQYKDFVKCESMAMAKLSGKYEQPMTKALLVGSFVDAYFEGTINDFIKSHPEIYTLKSELRSEFKKANDIIKRIQSDETFMKFLGGEKQRIMTFELFGTKWKMKMDSYLHDICITDLKVLANFRSIPLWGYDIQGAIYQKGVEIVDGLVLPFYLAVATKEKVIDIDIFNITQKYLDMALEGVAGNMPRFIAVKNGEEEPKRCGVCEHCKQTKRATIRNYTELMEVQREANQNITRQNSNQDRYV